MEGQFLIQMYQRFQQKRKSRQKIRIALDPKFQAQLDVMEYVILSKYQKNAKSLFKQKNNQLCDKTFKRGFKQLTDPQKMYYYNLFIDFLQRVVAMELQPPIQQKENYKTQGYSKTYSKIGWTKVNLKLDFDKKYLYIERQHKMNAYDLSLYFMRRSKATQYNTIVLQAISDVVNQKGSQIHVGFKDVKIFRECYDHIKKIIQSIIWQKIKSIVYPSNILHHIQNSSKIVHAQKENYLNSSKVRSHQDLQESKEDFDNPKLYQSTYVQSQKNIQLVDNKFNHTGIKRFSQSQSQKSQRSIQKSSHSIEIKQSPRSSMKPQTCLQILKSQNQQQDSFRSFGQLGSDDVENQFQQMMIFHRLIPNYQIQFISNIDSSVNQEVYNSTNNEKIQQKIIIYSNNQKSKKIKSFMQINCNSIPLNYENFCKNFSTPQFFKVLNHQIDDLSVKTVLSSDNCIIMYQKNKSYNRLYRSRDFVFLRHQFQRDGRMYVVDKSVEDSTIPPFTTIVRGQMTVIYEIYQEQQKIIINVDATIQNLGYLKDLQQLNINLKFFKGFQNLSQRLVKFDIKSISALFELNWPKKKLKSQQNLKQNQIQKQQKLDQRQNKSSRENNLTIQKEKELKQNQFNKISLRQTKKQKIHQNAHSPSKKSSQQTLSSNGKQKQNIKSKKQSPIKQNKDIKTQSQPNNSEVSQAIIKDQIFQVQEDMELQGQISFVDNQDMKNTIVPSKVHRNFNKDNGAVIIDYSCFKKRQILSPQNKRQYIYLKNSTKNTNENPLWKGNWEFPEEGGLLFINKKQIQDQKGVLKFIFSQVAKNLVSGKSILNISLPVDIFSSQSNLQRFIYSMAYAPTVLETTAKQPGLNRFINTTVFGMTMSPLYLDMEKPFNPILGQTFQCQINGCPAYAEQISHHPPIAAVMLYGRGYRISAQIQSKMKLNINSGAGVNEGVFRILYEDEQQICYICPSGQVCGLAYGDRKFNMIGKAYAWSQKSSLFLQINFNPNKSYFSKQQTPIDYFQGKILKVKQSFIKHFINKKYSSSPKKSDILEQLGKFHGRWNKQLKFQDRVLFNYEKQYPLQIEYEQYPLPSDSNWRQDIAYRRALQISQAQMWKQKWQVQQRSQRKLRQKYQKQKKK